MDIGILAVFFIWLAEASDWLVTVFTRVQSFYATWSSILLIFQPTLTFYIGQAINKNMTGQ